MRIFKVLYWKSVKSRGAQARRSKILDKTPRLKNSSHIWCTRVYPCVLTNIKCYKPGTCGRPQGLWIFWHEFFQLRKFWGFELQIIKFQKSSRSQFYQGGRGGGKMICLVSWYWESHWSHLFFSVTVPSHGIAKNRDLASKTDNLLRPKIFKTWFYV